MSSSKQELPCLAFHCRDRHSTALYTVPEENLMVALNASDKEEALRNKTICPTARGLLLARDPNTMATFLWRPEDGDQIHLPPLEGLDDGVLVHSHCVLSDEPSAPGCVVLLVEGCDDTFLWYCRPGDDAWVKHEYDVGTITLPYEYQGSNHLKIPICPVAACRGKFYFNGGPEDLGVLEFCPDPVFTSIAIDDSYESGDDEEGHHEDEEYRPNPGALGFLVESGDELYSVTLLFASLSSNKIDEGFVQKMDFSARRWRGVHDLGGRTFLVSSFYFGASCYGGGESGLRQDCVYFLNPYKEMQVFNVKEDTNEVHRLDEAPQFDKAFWLLPSTSP
ncbi:unnamed protein product [Urochloa decumbens]|uniref:KIB1-4 beta-propeller domain-containing protein n=1 Tax=Urochloa decumbens TaxID=240449 RepID=A0ABC8YMZ9_9POAL